MFEHFKQQPFGSLHPATSFFDFPGQSGRGWGRQLVSYVLGGFAWSPIWNTVKGLSEYWLCAAKVASQQAYDAEKAKSAQAEEPTRISKRSQNSKVKSRTKRNRLGKIL